MSKYLSPSDEPVSKEVLLSQRFGVRAYPIPGVGVVRVRPLTRGEALEMVGKEYDQAELECKLLSIAMIEPALTEADVRHWQLNATAGELADFVEFVQDISGMKAAAAKSGLPDAGERT